MALGIRAGNQKVNGESTVRLYDTVICCTNTQYEFDCDVYMYLKPFAGKHLSQLNTSIGQGNLYLYKDGGTSSMLIYEGVYNFPTPQLLSSGAYLKYNGDEEGGNMSFRLFSLAFTED